jgi:hypothetical protein
MDEKEQCEIQTKFPFLSCIIWNEQYHVCIIQNADEKIISYYCFDAIKQQSERRLFLELGEIWWWESNRQLPINIFLRQEMEVFKPYLRTVNVKDTEIAFGPVTSLNDLFKKRIKRRQIQLVKKDK